MMRVSEVARRLDVSGKAVYALIASGKLRAYRIGGSYRVDEHQLREFLDGAVTGAIAPIGAIPSPRREPVFKHDRPGRRRLLYPEPDAPPRP